MNQPESQPTTEALQQALREHCLKRAESLYTRIGEAVEHLREGNHLAALGAVTGLDEGLGELASALRLIRDLVAQDLLPPNPLTSPTTRKQTTERRERNV